MTRFGRGTITQFNLNMKKKIKKQKNKTLKIQFHDAPLVLLDVLSMMNLVFTLFFFLETVLKLIAFGIKVCKKNKNFLNKIVAEHNNLSVKSNLEIILLQNIYWVTLKRFQSIFFLIKKKFFRIVYSLIQIKEKKILLTIFTFSFTFFILIKHFFSFEIYIQSCRKLYTILCLVLFTQRS